MFNHDFHLAAYRPVSPTLAHQAEAQLSAGWQAKLPGRFSTGERIIGFQLSWNGGLGNIFLMFREGTARMALPSIRTSATNCRVKR
ncbi:MULTISPECIES: hypothetical protein [Rhizobium]|uniref:Uncharacterized protein n=1 Tax=Rhizobium tropici TaxID=398 RepID=A0A6P1C3F7_RHITR|nr:MULTISPECIES: hypothetical protein [Rhizobium]MBB4243507.1 hypothetical protein [Rhizobium tropici]MBB5593163.1 hypothetical protein [Rhizobium tropici]MBB6493650.1 hypothetical protein [Rhizobium tropici]NEV09895.1 hypothetical protein [Rhizobium tropici]